jgi:hypothetical protein
LIAILSRTGIRIKAQQWATVVRMTRRKDLYLIVPWKYGDIYDFKDLAKTSMRKEDTKGGKISWLQIRWLRCMKEKPDCLLFKYPGQNLLSLFPHQCLQECQSHCCLPVVTCNTHGIRHTQMVYDSMHYAIAFAKRKTEIFVPQQWATVVRMTRRKDLYLIVPWKYGDIYDFKDPCNTHGIR